MVASGTLGTFTATNTPATSWSYPIIDRSKLTSSWKVNRIGGLPQADDVNYAACKFHKPLGPNMWVKEKYVGGYAWTEQKYSAALPGWEQPTLWTHIDGLRDTTTAYDTKYDIYSYYYKHYDDKKCEPIQQWDAVN